jgi:hypothetical protein
LQQRDLARAELAPRVRAMTALLAPPAQPFVATIDSRSVYAP